MTEKAVIGRVPVIKRYGAFKNQRKTKYYIQYNPVRCPFCGTTFVNKTYLRRHIKIYHRERRCPYCGKRFFDIFKYNRHIREHLSQAKND